MSRCTSEGRKDEVSRAKSAMDFCSKSYLGSASAVKRADGPKSSHPKLKRVTLLLSMCVSGIMRLWALRRTPSKVFSRIMASPGLKKASASISLQSFPRNSTSFPAVTESGKPTLLQRGRSHQMDVMSARGWSTNEENG